MSSLASMSRYESCLRDHVGHREDERVLLRAYELGRELMENGVGVLDVVRIHAEAVAALSSARPVDVPTLAQAEGFLAEVLAPFEMAYLGFREANVSLRRMAESLEEQVEERTRELKESLSALQAADAERLRLMARAVSAQEQERHRIADDLHDDTIQVMTAVALRLSMLYGRLPSSDHPSLEQLEEVVTDTIGRLRRLVFELRPPALEREGLAAAVGVYLRRTFDDEFGHTVIDRLEEEPPLEAREIAYRVAQEALANVRKHADATQVTVTIEPYRAGVRLAVADDGAGFDPRQLDAPRPGHLGTVAMRERAALAGGWCTIDSATGRGTTVVAYVPHRHPATDPTDPTD